MKLEQEQAPLPYTYVAHDEHDSRHQGAVSIPIYQNTLFSYASCDEPGHAFKYSRMGNPTVQELEKRVAVLEGGEQAQCFASGMAAISSAILSVVKTGDHVVCVDQVYFGTREFFEYFLSRYGVEVSYADGASIDALSAAIRPNTTLLYLESPTSYYFQLQNLKEASKLAGGRGITTIVDNTWASPCYQHPLALGVDLVVHSLTKYVGGHSDVLGGAVIGSAERIGQLSRIDHQLLGGVMAPHTASLMLRGMRTLPLRMQRLSESVQQVATFMQSIPCVRKVNFPGLPDHPQHELAQEQMRGYGSLFSVEVKGTVEQAKAWVDHLHYFRIGLSFGGYESLALVVGPTKDSVPEVPVCLIRLNVGLEDPQDLIRDLGTISRYY